MKKISLPKIGIRPVIDGRRMGVRESLEEQTMNMAKATAALIAEKLRHACGAQIECVIADSCIAGMAESAACEEKFSSQNVGVTITVTPCWCYGSETIDMDPLRPKAIWGFNGTERPGAVYLAAALAAHCQKGIPAFSIYGHDVQDADDTSIPEDVRTRLLSGGQHEGQKLSFRRRRVDGDRRFYRRSQLLRVLARYESAGGGHDRAAPPHRPENL